MFDVIQKEQKWRSVSQNEMPRVLLSGETDATTLQEKEECMRFGMLRKTSWVGIIGLS
jgi:hypothetical protein